MRGSPLFSQQPLRQDLVAPGLGAVPEVIAGAEGTYSDAVGLAGHNQGFHRNFSEHGAALFRDTQEQVS